MNYPPMAMGRPPHMGMVPPGWPPFPPQGHGERGFPLRGKTKRSSSSSSSSSGTSTDRKKKKKKKKKSKKEKKSKKSRIALAEVRPAPPPIPSQNVPATRVFVGNLFRGANAEDLRLLFPYYEIDNATVLKQQEHLQGGSAAIVAFKFPDEALEVINMFNYRRLHPLVQTLLGVRMAHERKPDDEKQHLREQEKKKWPWIYICGLSPAITWVALDNLISKISVPVKIKIMPGTASNSASALVRMNTDEDAKAVQKYLTKPSEQGKAPNTIQVNFCMMEETCLLLRNIPADTSRDRIRDFLDSCNVKLSQCKSNVQAMRDNSGRYYKIRMRSEEEAFKLLDIAADKREFFDTPTHIMPNHYSRSDVVIIRNLPSSFALPELEELFSRYNTQPGTCHFFTSDNEDICTIEFQTTGAREALLEEYCTKGMVFNGQSLVIEPLDELPSFIQSDSDRDSKPCRTLALPIVSARQIELAGYCLIIFGLREDFWRALPIQLVQFGIVMDQLCQGFKGLHPCGVPLLHRGSMRPAYQPSVLAVFDTEESCQTALDWLQRTPNHFGMGESEPLCAISPVDNADLLWAGHPLDLALDELPLADPYRLPGQLVKPPVFVPPNSLAPQANQPPPFAPVPFMRGMIPMPVPYGMPPMMPPPHVGQHGRKGGRDRGRDRERGQREHREREQREQREREQREKDNEKDGNSSSELDLSD